MRHNIVEVKLYPNIGKLYVRYVGDVDTVPQYIPHENLDDKSISMYCAEGNIIDTIQIVLNCSISRLINNINHDTAKIENLKKMLKSYTTGYPGQEEILEKCERLCEGINISDSKSSVINVSNTIPNIDVSDKLNRRKRVDVTKLVL